MFSFDYISWTAETILSVFLVLAWLFVLRWARYSGWGIAALTLIGTICHEALHAVVGWIVCAKPTSFSIIPRRKENGWILGSVGFRNLNIWNSAPAAFAPILLIFVAWAVFCYWMQPAFHGNHYVNWVLSGYVAAVALFSSVPSHIDIKMGATSAIMYFCICATIWLYIINR